MDTREARASALTAASRAVPQAEKNASHVLSTARLFCRYIETGLSQTRPNSRQGLRVGVDGIEVAVDGLPVDGNLADELTEAIRRVLA